MALSAHSNSFPGISIVTRTVIYCISFWHSLAVDLLSCLGMRMCWVFYEIDGCLKKFLIDGEGFLQGMFLPLSCAFLPGL